ncbi:MAG: FAD-binding oxidoreductase [Alphaproteobacteria bacterium]|nr:FAD-binding oxidoreductase [Alphaproteobacteria bacterium]
MSTKTEQPWGTPQGSLWAATAAPAPETQPLQGPVHVDVAVIGAGVFGLSLALHLAQRGCHVVVLERGAIGDGASGRNGGLVVPSLPRLMPAAVRRVYGAAAGDRLAHLVGSGGSLIWSLIAQHQITCDASATGWINPAHRPSRLPAVAERVRQWQALGQPVALWDGDQTAATIGSRQFAGALFDPTGGHLNPLSYVRGLARAALAAGVEIAAATEVTTVLRQDSRWHLATPRGTVQADRVVWATNAASGPGVMATVPLLVHQMATQPLPASVRARVLVGSPSLSDTRNNLFSARWTADGRLGTGGMASWQPAAAAPRLARRLARRLEVQLDLTPNSLTMEYAWTGIAALTPGLVPRLAEVAPGVLVPLACNGRGLCLATALGAALAAWLATNGTPPIPLTPLKDIPHHWLARLLPRLLLPLGDWQDGRG